MTRLGDAVSIFVLSGTAFAQGGRGILAHNAANDNKPYDKHDLSGIRTRNGSPGGYGGGTCRDCGDREYGAKVQPMTALGKKMFDADKPSYGRLLGSTDAAAHPEEDIGRRRAVPPANDSDPYQHCNPMGPTRALAYVDPMEMNVLPDRIIQQFEWGWGTRILWTDGRPPLMDPDLPRWWGYSTGHWDGETGDLKTFRKLDKNTIKSIDGWAGMLEDACAPADEVDLFNKRVRDPAGGVIH